MPRFGVHLLLVIVLAGAHLLPWSSVDTGRKSTNADARAQVAIRAPSVHAVSIARLKDAGIYLISCGLGSHSYTLSPPANATYGDHPGSPMRLWNVRGCVLVTSRPPPLA